MKYSASMMPILSPGHQIGQLVHEWLHNAADEQVRHTLALPERLQLVHGLMALLGRPGTACGLDWEDVQAVLRQARGVWLGRARTTGPERASLVAEQVWQSGLQIGPSNGSAGGLLLVIRTGAEQALEMDELTAITKAIQLRAGEDCDVVFGFGTDDTLGQQLETLLLVGYG